MKSRFRLAVLGLVLALAVAVAAGGCRRSPSTEKELVKLCQDYTVLFAEKKFAECREYLTGEALTQFELGLPLLEATKAVQSRVSDFRGAVDFVNRSGDRASVRCTWLQEDTVPGAGTVVNRMDVAYDVVKLKGRWLISAVKLLAQETGGK
ncbi:MAG: hypothetical protein AB1609_18395 [Bacillota bacterium]